VSLINKARIRQIHAQLAPIMIFPLLLTVITGSLFQVAALTNNVDNFIWLLDWHRGKFGRINLEMIYPFLNAFGLLMVGTTGITIWLQTRSRRKLPHEFKKRYSKDVNQKQMGIIDAVIIGGRRTGFRSGN